MLYSYLQLLRNVRSKCECAHTMLAGMVLVVKPYIHHIYIVTNIQECARKLKNSSPNLSEGGSLRSPISKYTTTLCRIDGDVSDANANVYGDGTPLFSFLGVETGSV